MRGDTLAEREFRLGALILKGLFQNMLVWAISGQGEDHELAECDTSSIRCNFHGVCDRRVGVRSGLGRGHLCVGQESVVETAVYHLKTGPHEKCIAEKTDRDSVTLRALVYLIF